jgi:hypothetical protein
MSKKYSSHLQIKEGTSKFTQIGIFGLQKYHLATLERGQKFSFFYATK